MKMRLNNRLNRRTAALAGALLLAIPQSSITAVAALSPDSSALIALHSSESPAIPHLRAIQDLINTFKKTKTNIHYEGPFSEEAWKRPRDNNPEIIEITKDVLKSEHGLWIQVMYLEKLVEWAKRSGYLGEQSGALIVKDENWFEKALEEAPVILRMADSGPVQQDRSLSSIPNSQFDQEKHSHDPSLSLEGG